MANRKPSWAEPKEGEEMQESSAKKAYQKFNALLKKKIQIK